MGRPPGAAELIEAAPRPRCEQALVGVNLRARGQRGQVRALMVLDYWGRLPTREIANVARQLAPMPGSL